MATETDFRPLSPDDHLHGTKSAAEIRKQNKPLMEKRRRARINESLNKLKSLVLDAMKRDTSRYSKLEKADILEMTVKHLRSVQRNQMTAAIATDGTVVGKYRAGFVECASEVSRYLNSIDGLDPAVKGRLLNHLGDCTHKVSSLTAIQESRDLSRQHGFIQQQHQLQQQQLGLPQHLPHIPDSTPTSTLPGYSNLNINNSNNRMNGGFQVMSSTMPSNGHFALLVPTLDNYRATSISPESMTSQSVFTNDNTRGISMLYGSQSPNLMSPPMTSPSGSSDHAFRFNSMSDHSSSGSEDENETAALDMRLMTSQTQQMTSQQSHDYPRDINDNIIRPEPRHAESKGQNKPFPSSSTVGLKKVAHNNNVLPVKQEVPTDNMWRPW